MPAQGIPLQPRAEILDIEEIHRLARLLVSAGVTKIRVTGGEPLVRKGIEPLLKGLSDLGVKSLGMTTNGVLLSRRLEAVLAAGVTHINISLDTFRPERFAFITRRENFELVMHAIDRALAAPLRAVKLNCVLMRGFNDDELSTFVEFTRTRAIGVRFIEYMPFNGNEWDFSRLYPFSQMMETLEARFDLVPMTPESPNETAVVYQVPGYAGTVGFISSMTQHFCASCNRLRLTADGNLKNCLFDNGEVSLRDPMREGATDDELMAIMRSAVQRKFAHHGGHESPERLAQDPGRSMIQIGG